MPKIRELTQMPPMPEGDAEAQVDALRDYLLRITEELTYLLTHLEADNINDSTFERIAGMIPKAAITAPPMDGQGSAGSSSTWARGDHQHPEDRNKADVSALAALAAELAAHVADKLNPHEVTAAQVGYDNSESGLVSENVQDAMDEAIDLAISLIPTDPADIGAIPTSEKGSAGGVAELDSSGHVPSSQLPSYVDDVKEYPSVTDFPIPGESDKIYIALDTELFYRWGGTMYAPTNPSLALGETSSTAYRGDRGKAAYDHSQTTSGNPHNVSASDVGLGNVANERQYSAQNPPPLPTPADIGAATAQDLTDHVGDTNNPHGVTAAQVGVVPNPVDPATDTLTKMQVGSTVYEITGGGGGGPEPATATPLMDGTGAVGSSLKYAREDHEHPADTNKQDAITASGILKGDGNGGVSAAAAGTDYQAPLTAGTDYATPGMIPTVPSAYTSNPAMDGTASPGSSGSWAKGDHVHPSDTSKANVADFHNANTKESLLDCNGYSTPLQVYQALMSNPGATGAGDIGNLQSSQLKNFLTNPFYNYTHITFEFVSTGLIRVVARNASDATNPGKMCYLKGIINNLGIDANWSVTAWEDIIGLVTQAMIAKVIGSPAGQNVGVGDYVIYNGQLYIATGSFTSSVYPATYLSYLTQITDGGLNAVSKIAYKEVTLGTDVLGTSFSQTSRMIGNASTLFGVAADKILSIIPRDNSMTPAANFSCGFYAGNFYLATTQTSTLSSSVKFNITYIR